MPKTIIDHLKQVRLFSTCSDAQLAQISRLTTRVTVPADKSVASQGEVGREFLVIADGTATVSIDGRPIARLGAGDFFGEVALLDGGRRTASVTADTDLVIDARNSREFGNLPADFPDITRAVLRGVAAWLRAADASLPS